MHSSILQKTEIEISNKKQNKNNCAGDLVSIAGGACDLTSMALSAGFVMSPALKIALLPPEILLTNESIFPVHHLLS